MEPESAAILKKQIHKESATLFMGNLPFDATEEALRDLIEEHAEGASTPAAKAESQPAEDQENVAADPEEGADAETKEGQVYIDKRGGKLSGLRKVRLGAFEDTGRCKG